MNLSNQLTEYVSAAFTAIWIESREHEDALREIAQLCRDQDWALATWNVDSGLQIPGAEQPADAGGSDPLAAIRSINALASPDSSAILVLQNFHRFTQSAEIVQALAQQVVTGKQNRTFIIILAPVVDIPVELEKVMVVVEHELPVREQLEEIARGIATEEGELPEGEALETVLDAAAGLTRYEAEGAFSLSLVRDQEINAATVWELKAQMLKRSGLLSLHRGSDRFAGLGGLEGRQREGYDEKSRHPRHHGGQALSSAHGVLSVVNDSLLNGCATTIGGFGRLTGRSPVWHVRLPIASRAASSTHRRPRRCRPRSRPGGLLGRCRALSSTCGPGDAERMPGPRLPPAAEGRTPGPARR
jgi:hypothetical protein